MAAAAADTTMTVIRQIGTQGPAPGCGNIKNALIATDEGDDEYEEDDDGSEAEDEPPAIDSFYNFLSTFFGSKAGIHILVTASLLSIGVGCTVGIVPDFMANRFARLHHGYDGEADCATFDRISKPDACQMGADDSQEAAAISNLVKNLLTLVFNSIIGSLSDVYGRRPVLISSIALSMLSPMVLVMMQMSDAIDPFWWYALDSSIGLVNIMSASFTALSDVMPHRYRAASFGLFTGTFFLWFAVAPLAPLLMSQGKASALSFVVIALAVLYSLCALPETLSSHVAEHNASIQAATTPRTSLSFLMRPIQEMSILYRNYALRLIAIGSFLSGAVFASDATLFLYYVEDQLNVRDSDLASMFLVMGIVGVIVQVFLLKFLISWFGEKRLTVITFVSGTFHNLFYGLARSKFLIYVALSLSQLTKVNFPLLSSIASVHLNEFEQGRLQGALFALSALANGIGPMIMQQVYNQTKDERPGLMFVVAAGLYLTGTIFVSFLPPKRNRDDSSTRSYAGDVRADMEEPLLAEHSTTS